MLVLTRRIGEEIVIGGDVVVSVQRINGKRVRFSIDAPGNVKILRGELQPTPVKPAGPEPAAPRLTRSR